MLYDKKNKKTENANGNCRVYAQGHSLVRVRRGKCTVQAPSCTCSGRCRGWLFLLMRRLLRVSGRVGLQRKEARDGIDNAMLCNAVRRVDRVNKSDVTHGERQQGRDAAVRLFSQSTQGALREAEPCAQDLFACTKLNDRSCTLSLSLSLSSSSLFSLFLFFSSSSSLRHVRDRDPTECTNSLFS